jgi:hypothetical protein
MFISGVNDTGEKLFSGVNDTGKKFIAGVNLCHGFSVIASVVDTGEQLSPLTMTPAITFFPGVNDVSQNNQKA